MKKRALVVGGAGIRGGKILTELLREGYIVYSLDDGPSKVSAGRVVNLFCGKRNENVLREMLHSHRFDCVIDAASRTRDDAEMIYRLLDKSCLRQYRYLNPHRFRRGVGRQPEPLTE